MKAVVHDIDLPARGRLLAVSDVHGNLPWLRGLLERARFSSEDALVLVGDLVEKGPESLATLRYVINLSRTHTVYTLCGNCDNLAVDFVYGGSGLDRDFYRYYLRVWGERALIVQMAREAGLPAESPEDLPALRAGLAGAFAPELQFLRGLPTILTAPNYVFVHGGVPSYRHMEALDAWKCMKNDNFLGQGHAFPYYCVVGHWPVSLYRAGVPCCAPLIDRDRKIASIDGGCVLQADGQLNALVLPRAGEDFSWCAYDDCPVVRALDAQEASPDPFTIHWSDHDVEVLERGEEFSRCRHLSTGRTLWVLTKYLRRQGNRTWCRDSTDYRLPVRPGDLLSVVEETSRGILAKKNGYTGWYAGRLEAL